MPLSKPTAPPVITDVREGPMMPVIGPKRPDELPNLRISDEGSALIAGAKTVRHALDLLAANERFADGVAVLAVALPAREVVWWACLCLRLATKDAPAKDIDAALSLATGWVLQPGEEARKRAADVKPDRTAAGYLIQAVTWTGGSLLPDNLPVVPPNPTMPGAAIRACLMTFAAKQGPKIADTLREFVALGMQVARGRFHSTGSSPLAAPRGPHGEPGRPVPPPTGHPRGGYPFTGS